MSGTEVDYVSKYATIQAYVTRTFVFLENKDEQRMTFLCVVRPAVSRCSGWNSTEGSGCALIIVCEFLGGVGMGWEVETHGP